MRKIVKQKEPSSLIAHRKTIGAQFDDCNKDDIRKRLVDEQRGLCCYCCNRIKPATASMKIEHFVPQSVDQSRALDYRNMLGACKGGEGAETEPHCDTRRGNQSLTFNPADPARDVGALIKVRATGQISSDDPTFAQEIEHVLGLNLETLVTARREQVKTVTDWWQMVHRVKHRRPNANELAAELARREPSEGDLAPFQFAAVWWLKNKVAS